MCLATKQTQSQHAVLRYDVQASQGISDGSYFLATFSTMRLESPGKFLDAPPLLTKANGQQSQQSGMGKRRVNRKIIKGKPALI